MLQLDVSVKLVIIDFKLRGKFPEECAPTIPWFHVVILLWLIHLCVLLSMHSKATRERQSIQQADVYNLA